MIDEVNVYTEILAAVTAYDEHDDYTFGKLLGEATLKMFTKEVTLDRLEDSPSPKSVYFNKIGSDFANGFLYGSSVGHFD